MQQDSDYQTENNNNHQSGIDVEEVTCIYNEYVDANNQLLPSERIKDILARLEVHASVKYIEDIVSSITNVPEGEQAFLSLEETLAVCQLVGSPPVSRGTVSTEGKQKFLTQRRSYMDSGVLNKEQALLEYLQKLEVHKRKCEQEGRYMEARASAQKLAQLKTAQAQHFRDDMIKRHSGEKRTVSKIFEDESQELDRMWKERQQQYKQHIQEQFQELKSRQKNELDQFYALKESRRPIKPHASRDLLNQRMIQQHLAKQGQYRRADILQRMTNMKESSELAKTMQDFEREWGAKEKKIIHQHQQELETLKQRALRGKNEMMNTQSKDKERRFKRFNNIMHDLDNLQKVEVVHLESFLEGQAIAGKRKHLRDTSFKKMQTVNKD